MKIKDSCLAFLIPSEAAGMQTRELVLFSYGQKDTDALAFEKALVIGEQRRRAPP
jgi:hypothetical protein